MASIPCVLFASLSREIFLPWRHLAAEKRAALSLPILPPSTETLGAGRPLSSTRKARFIARQPHDAVKWGRTVRCLDPMNLVGGSDHWNPLASLDPNNIIYLQRLTRALLPAVVAEENAYFNNRAVDAVVAALLAANHDGRTDGKRCGGSQCGLHWTRCGDFRNPKLIVRVGAQSIFRHQLLGNPARKRLIDASLDVDFGKFIKLTRSTPCAPARDPPVRYRIVS